MSIGVLPGCGSATAGIKMDDYLATTLGIKLWTYGGMCALRVRCVAIPVAAFNEVVAEALLRPPDMTV